MLMSASIIFSGVPCCRHHAACNSCAILRQYSAAAKYAISRMCDTRNAQHKHRRGNRQCRKSSAEMASSARHAEEFASAMRHREGNRWRRGKPSPRSWQASISGARIRLRGNPPRHRRRPSAHAVQMKNQPMSSSASRFLRGALHAGCRYRLSFESLSRNAARLSAMRHGMHAGMV